MKAVIRAGGIGTRLWPLSTVAQPKQFQPILDEKSMLRQTYERLADLLGTDNLFISVQATMLTVAREQVPELPADHWFSEPLARNTGPAIALELLYLQTLVAPTEIIISVPADDFVANPEALQTLLQLAAKFLTAQPDYILMPVVQPVYPDLGYSYLSGGETLLTGAGVKVASIQKIVEKPDEVVCRQIIGQGFVCHIGMYIWCWQTIYNLFAILQPAMLDQCQKILALLRAGEVDTAIQMAGSVQKITIESAITNLAPQVAMILSDDLVWSDVGKWHIVKRLLSGIDELQNLERGQVVVRHSQNCLLFNLSARQVLAVNDLRDTVVVVTDRAVLVSSLVNSAEVKQIVGELEARDWQEYL